MAWVRFDDGFPEHPKVDAAGGDAAWLHVCAISYCNRALTDGFIKRERVRLLSDRKAPYRLAARLVEVGLWEEADGGYVVHDYHDYQPTRAEVLDQQASVHAAKVRAGRAGGVASGVARRKHERSRDEADGQAKAKQNEAPSRPVPSSSLSSSSTSNVDALRPLNEDDLDGPDEADGLIRLDQWRPTA
jgi:hypothetical protein